MQAMILAAGMGKRLKQLTQNNTKCMGKGKRGSHDQPHLKPADICAPFPGS